MVDTGVEGTRQSAPLLLASSPFSSAAAQSGRLAGAAAAAAQSDRLRPAAGTVATAAPLSLPPTTRRRRGALKLSLKGPGASGWRVAARQDLHALAALAPPLRRSGWHLRQLELQLDVAAFVEPAGGGGGNRGEGALAAAGPASPAPAPAAGTGGGCTAGCRPVCCANKIGLMELATALAALGPHLERLELYGSAAPSAAASPRGFPSRPALPLDLPPDFWSGLADMGGLPELSYLMLAGASAAGLVGARTVAVDGPGRPGLPGLRGLAVSFLDLTLPALFACACPAGLTSLTVFRFKQGCRPLRTSFPGLAEVTVRDWPAGTELAPLQGLPGLCRLTLVPHSQYSAAEGPAVAANLHHLAQMSTVQASYLLPSRRRGDRAPRVFDGLRSLEVLTVDSAYSSWDVLASLRLAAPSLVRLRSLTLRHATRVTPEALRCLLLEPPAPKPSFFSFSSCSFASSSACAPGAAGSGGLSAALQSLVLDRCRGPGLDHRVSALPARLGRPSLRLEWVPECAAEGAGVDAGPLPEGGRRGGAVIVVVLAVLVFVQCS
ncbi:hypothetical protein GPECTOR_1g362 [Gonium pectorale]|uniref:Uncharacterized protein n=1 Tax=Gonium pectorale TaxID=33097 RepID=A0A150H2K3_GONPE|nr:hypothetical protein GPECTOR_1g362 [Gonium pectorale]|eukprot:KXZ56407.1 hypothetical protein GPECTOR_1g362 [Gonium pectorale]